MAEPVSERLMSFLQRTHSHRLIVPDRRAAEPHRESVTDQVGSDAQVLSDGVLVLSEQGRRLADARPPRVDFFHRVFGNFRENGFGRFVFLQR